MKQVVNIILGLILAAGSVNAQEMFVTSGSAGESDKASLSWVVGGGVVQNQNDVAPIFASEIVVKENVAMSFSENLSKVNISVYPNPAVEYINVSSSSVDLDGGHVVITDLSGKQVLSQSVNEDKTSLYVSSLASGVYMVSVVNKYGVFEESVKVVKK